MSEEPMVAGTLKQEIAGIRKDVHDLRDEVADLRTLVKSKQPEVVSISDVTSTSTQERVVSMNDSQRVYLAAAVKNTETHTLLAAAASDKQQFWQTRLGILSIIFGIICGLILAGAAIYSTFVGLSHSVLGH